jgi:hypothetical protein
MDALFLGLAPACLLNLEAEVALRREGFISWPLSCQSGRARALILIY